MWIRAMLLGVSGLVAAGLALSPAPAQACSCTSPGPVETELSQAAAVFQGTVETVERSPRAFKLFPGGDNNGRTARFEVARRWKGAVERVQSVVTPPDDAACGIGFVAGESYVVYARAQPDGTLAAVLCSRTRFTRDAAEDLAALGPGEPPLEGGGCAVGGAAPGLLPVLVMVVALRRRR